MSTAALGLASLQARKRTVLEAELRLQQHEQSQSYKTRGLSKQATPADTAMKEWDQERFTSDQDEDAVEEASRVPSHEKRRGLLQLQRLHPTAVTLALARSGPCARRGGGGGPPWHRPLPWERRTGDPQPPEQDPHDEAAAGAAGAASEAPALQQMLRAAAHSKAPYIPAAAAASPSLAGPPIRGDADTSPGAGTQAEHGGRQGDRFSFAGTTAAVQRLRSEAYDVASATHEVNEQRTLYTQLLEYISGVMSQADQDATLRARLDALAAAVCSRVQQQCEAGHQQLRQLIHRDNPSGLFFASMLNGWPFGDLGHAAEMGWVRPGLDRQYPDTWGWALRLAEAGEAPAAKVLRQALCGALMLVGPWPNRNREGGMDLDMWACAALAALVGLLLDAGNSGTVSGSQACRLISPHLLYQSLLSVPPLLVVRSAIALAAGSEAAPPWLAAVREARSLTLRFSALHVETVAYCYAKAPAFLQSLVDVCQLATLRGLDEGTAERWRGRFMAAAATCPGRLIIAVQKRTPRQAAAEEARSTSMGSEGDGNLWEASLHRQGAQRSTPTETLVGKANPLTDEQHGEAWSDSAGSGDIVPETEDGEEGPVGGSGEVVGEGRAADAPEAEEDDASSDTSGTEPSLDALLQEIERSFDALQTKGLLSASCDPRVVRCHLALVGELGQPDDAARRYLSDPVMRQKVPAAYAAHNSWLQNRWVEHVKMQRTSDAVSSACRWALHRQRLSLSCQLREAVEALCPGLLAVHPDTWGVAAKISLSRFGHDTQEAMHLALAGLAVALGLDLPREALLMPLCVMTGAAFKHGLASQSAPARADEPGAWAAAARCLMYLVYMHLPYVAIRHEENQLLTRSGPQQHSPPPDFLPRSGRVWQEYYRELLWDSLDVFIRDDWAEEGGGFGFSGALCVQAMVDAPEDSSGRGRVRQLTEEAQALYAGRCAYQAVHGAGDSPEQDDHAEADSDDGGQGERAAGEVEEPQEGENPQGRGNGTSKPAAHSTAAAIAAGALPGSCALQPAPGQRSQPLQVLYTVLTAGWVWCNAPTGQLPPAPPARAAAAPGDVTGGVARPATAASSNPAAGAGPIGQAATSAAPLSVTVAGAEELWAVCNMFCSLNHPELRQYLVFQPEPVAAVTEGPAAAPAPASVQSLPLQPLRQQLKQTASKGRPPDAKAAQQAAPSPSSQAGEHPVLTLSRLALATLQSHSKEPPTACSYRLSEILRHVVVVTANSKLAQAVRLPQEALVKKRLRMVFVCSQGVAGLVKALEVMVKVRQKLQEEGRDMCVAATFFRPQPPDQAAEAGQRSRSEDQDAPDPADDADGSMERLLSARTGMWGAVHSLCRTVVSAHEERTLVDSGDAATRRMLAVLREECAARREAHVEFQLLECEPGRPWALVPPPVAGGAQGRQAGGGKPGKGGTKSELQRAMFG